MKKAISILLALLLALSFAACMKVKAGETKTEAKTETKTEVKAETKTETKSETKSNQAAVTAAPTPEPTAVPTPEPTEVPFEAAMAMAEEKLAQVKSLHMDMDMTMDMTITIAMGEMKQTMPMDIHMLYNMDVVTDPYATKLDVDLSAVGETMKGVIYVTREGEDVVLYSSDDNGVTWKKQVNPEAEALPQVPSNSFSQFAGADITRTGTDTVNGRTAAVYSGTVSGKFLSDILNNTGAAAELTEAMGADMSAEALGNLADIGVTIMIDEESGLPLRYIYDMGEAMKGVMEAAMLASMGGQLPEGLEMTVEMPAMTLDLILSDFDSVAPIVIPEAALNAR